VRVLQGGRTRRGEQRSADIGTQRSQLPIMPGPSARRPNATRRPLQVATRQDAAANASQDATPVRTHVPQDAPSGTGRDVNLQRESQDHVLVRVDQLDGGDVRAMQSGGTFDVHGFAG
jgi:hypothetical protein